VYTSYLIAPIEEVGLSDAVSSHASAKDFRGRGISLIARLNLEIGCISSCTSVEKKVVAY